MTRWIPAALATFGLAFGLPGAAPAAPEDVLAGDTRLARTVNLAVKDTPLTAVVRQLGRETGAVLTVDRRVADDKVTAFLGARPAHEAMAMIAAHFDLEWSPREGGFRLEQTEGARRREAALRQRARDGAMAAIEQRMAALARLASRSDAELDRRRTEIAGVLAQAPRSDSELEGLVEERAAIEDLRRPGGRAAAAVFGGISASQRRALRSGAELRMDSLPPALQAEVHRAAAAARGGMAMRSVTVTAGDGDPPALPERPAELPPVAAIATLKLAGPLEAGLGRAARMHEPDAALRLEVALTSVREQGGAREVRPVVWSPSVGALARDAAAVRGADSPELAREVLLALDAPPVGAGTAPSPLGGVSIAGTRTLGDALEALHAATGLSVLSDSFVRARVHVASVAGRRSALELLESARVSLRYGWSFEDGVIRLRSATYFDDRLSEAPESVLAPWREKVASAAAAGLNDYAALARAVTDPQLRSLDRYWAAYMRDVAVPPVSAPGGLFGSRFDLRFWALLAGPQRNAAAAGQIVPVAGMSLQQARAFAAALQAPSPIMGGAQPLGATQAEIAAGGFSLRASPARQLTFSGGNGGEQRAAVMIMETQEGGPAPPSLGGNGARPRAMPRITGPDGQELTLGEPTETVLDAFAFRYHLAGNPTPARMTHISIPRRGQPVTPGGAG
ncbi:MAG TPA: hypothetical protein VLH79_07290 [Chthonomonadales bacterium]|nr:hypothetical protein [Chthonomonadales bacterium]